MSCGSSARLASFDILYELERHPVLGPASQFRIFPSGIIREGPDHSEPCREADLKSERGRS